MAAVDFTTIGSVAAVSLLVAAIPVSVGADSVDTASACCSINSDGCAVAKMRLEGPLVMMACTASVSSSSSSMLHSSTSTSSSLPFVVVEVSALVDDDDDDEGAAVVAVAVALALVPVMPMNPSMPSSTRRKARSPSLRSGPLAALLARSAVVAVD